MDEQLDILNRIDPDYRYIIVPIPMMDDATPYYRLDGMRGNHRSRHYSPNLKESEMKVFLLGFTMGIEVQRNRRD